MNKIAPDWPEQYQRQFDLINRSPSACNLQLYTLHIEDQVLLIKPSFSWVKILYKYCTKYLDSGIAAAHACLAFEKNKFQLEKDKLIINI